jgi:hypothetical protein
MDTIPKIDSKTKYEKVCINGCGKVIEQDKLNRQTPFDPQKQLYPADLFILVGFDAKGQPIKERNPRWHTPDGFYIGRPKN